MHSTIQNPQRALLLAVAVVLASTLAVSAAIHVRSFRRRRRKQQQLREFLWPRNQLGSDETLSESDPLPSPTRCQTRRRRTNPNGAASNQSPHVDIDDDDVIRCQLDRNYLFLGQASMARLRTGLVVVVGVGAIGSHVACLLVRAGIQHIRLVDNGALSLSSLSRHAVAGRSDVGKSKVSCLGQYFSELAPHLRVDQRCTLLEDSSVAALLDGADYVLDCIDHLPAKVALLVHCYRACLPVISCMSATLKANPSRVRVADIIQTHGDPLARAVRRALRHHGILTGVAVVFSPEKPPVTSTPLPRNSSSLPFFRSSMLPVLSPLPALFAAAMVCHVLVHFGTPDPCMLPLPCSSAMSATLLRKCATHRRKSRRRSRSRRSSAASDCSCGSIDFSSSNETGAENCNDCTDPTKTLAYGILGGSTVSPVPPVIEEVVGAEPNAPESSTATPYSSPYSTAADKSRRASQRSPVTTVSRAPSSVVAANIQSDIGFSAMLPQQSSPCKDIVLGQEHVHLDLVS